MNLPGEDSKQPQRAPGAIGMIRLFGVPVRFHFTFWLVAVWLIYIGVTAKQSAAGSTLYVVILFLSVLLHEAGHALAARHFAIRTLEIVMLPLGGLARLERQPKPAEEFWVALAGPMVNFALGGALLGWAYLSGGTPAWADWKEPTDANLVPRLAVANLILALFNLLPAFPMDGGRVVRALLAGTRPVDQATQTTARLGTALAAAIGMYGLISANFLLVFLAFFIYVGATQESMAVATQVLIRGARVGEAMVTDFRTLNHGETIRDAANLLLSTSQKDFPVLAGSQVTGLLHRTALMRAMASEGPDGYVAGAMERAYARVNVDQSLEEAAPLVTDGCALVFDGERLAGLLTAENLSEFMILRQIRRAAVKPNE